MEFLRRILRQIKTQLGSLKWSEKLSIFLLVVVGFIGILWIAEYSAQQEMTPVLNQALSEQEMARITQKLDNWEQEYSIKGDRILVPRDQQRKLLFRLANAEALPQDITAGWNSLLEDADIWTPESVRESKELIVQQTMLALAIVNGWPEVEKAEVFINKGSKRRVGSITPEASAGVSVKLAPGASASRKMATAIAALVSGANNRMKRENVKVLANGKLIPVAAEGTELNSDYLEEQIK